MSNTDIKITATNQELFMDLNEEDAETISGGEVFTIKNLTKYNINYTIDNEQYNVKSGRSNNDIYTPYGGIIKFRVGNKLKSGNLADGKIYAFRPSRDGFDLYPAGAMW
ncbi:hypothetical protein [Nostoc sp. FACHB-133]|uniref:hypothetical protein n=1 Tax=Nostoc sp. FACHB-133 TaxID=2692835 RepID=UPI0016857FC8|nr:hypothetical protein [Nostoc sp. FACHB-133]MBD2527883.1 hypothetical protein [Nostoc sp. FACHB-133]